MLQMTKYTEELLLPRTAVKGALLTTASFPSSVFIPGCFSFPYNSPKTSEAEEV
jgi:hypothetical protein